MCDWTDATFSIIRYECGLAHRLLFRQCLTMQTDLKSVQHLVSVQKIRIERQYLQYLDESIPIQRCAKLVGRLFTARFDAILLHVQSQIDINSESQTNIREAYVHRPLRRITGRGCSTVPMLTDEPVASSNPV